MATPLFSETVRHRAEAPALKTLKAGHDLIGRHGSMADALLTHLKVLASKGKIRVLDVGAYDRAFGKSLAQTGLPVEYYSLDIDDSLPHDFHSLSEVTGTFDVISMFEVVEHIPYNKVDELLHGIYDLLAPQGRVFISTPNPFHPMTYFADVSHIQHWPPADLYALLRHVGFRKGAVELYGVLYSSQEFLRSLVDQTRGLVWRLIGIERRAGLLAVAVKE